MFRGSPYYYPPTSKLGTHFFFLSDRIGVDGNLSVMGHRKMVVISRMHPGKPRGERKVGAPEEKCNIFRHYYPPPEDVRRTSESDMGARRAPSQDKKSKKDERLGPATYRATHAAVSANIH